MFMVALGIGCLVLAAALLLLALFSRLDAAKLATGIRLFGPLLLLTIMGLIVWRVPVLAPLLLVLGFMLSLYLRSMRAGWRRPNPLGSGSKEQVSQSATGHIRMELDHRTGTLDGEVLTGRYAGRRLSELTVRQLRALWDEWQSTDDDTCALLRAYLDRRHPGWDRGDGEADGAPRGAASEMTEAEAWEILGLEPGAGEDAIKQAARELLKRFHPDKGGSTYLAAKINRAREILLGGRR